MNTCSYACRSEREIRLALLSLFCVTMYCPGLSQRLPNITHKTINLVEISFHCKNRVCHIRLATLIAQNVALLLRWSVRARVLVCSQKNYSNVLRSVSAENYYIAKMRMLRTAQKNNNALCGRCTSATQKPHCRYWCVTIEAISRTT